LVLRKVETLIMILVVRVVAHVIEPITSTVARPRSQQESAVGSVYFAAGALRTGVALGENLMPPP
jgi:hypothetical protein